MFMYRLIWLFSSLARGAYSTTKSKFLGKLKEKNNNNWLNLGTLNWKYYILNSQVYTPAEWHTSISSKIFMLDPLTEKHPLRSKCDVTIKYFKVLNKTKEQKLIKVELDKSAKNKWKEVGLSLVSGKIFVRGGGGW